MTARLTDTEKKIEIMILSFEMQHYPIKKHWQCLEITTTIDKSSASSCALPFYRKLFFIGNFSTGLGSSGECMKDSHQVQDGAKTKWVIYDMLPLNISLCFYRKATLKNSITPLKVR